MRKALLIAFASSLLSYEMHAASASDTESPSTKESPSSINAKAFIPFTGKITRNKVRMRNQAHLDAKIVRELNKGDMIVVVGENEDFYAVQPPPDIKAYVFRTFVLDNLIEGNKVNVRLAP